MATGVVRKAKMRLADMNPAPYNPKVTLTPDMPEYQDIKRSLETFGQVEDLVVNERTSNLVSGHQRRTVMMDMGWQEADTNIIDVDDTEERLLNLALSRVRGRVHEDKLAELLGTLRQQAAPLAVTGYKPEELTASLQRYTRLHAGDFLSSVLNPPQGNASAQVAQVFGTAPGSGSTYPPLGQGTTTHSYGAPSAFDDGSHDGADEDEDADDAPSYAGNFPPLPDSAYAAPAPHVQPQQEAYFQLVYTVTGPQREVIQAAIKLAKGLYGAETSQAALLEMCDEFLRRYHDRAQAMES